MSAIKDNKLQPWIVVPNSFLSTRKIPTGRDALGRLLYLIVKEKKFMSDASLTVAGEILAIWENMRKDSNLHNKNYYAEAALAILSRHLWYLSEIAIGLSFFDPRHSLNSPGDQQNLFRYKCAFKEANLKIVDLVSENTKMFFDIIGINYDFIQSSSSCWRENENFNKIEEFAINLTVVNDPAERAIGLLKTVNNTLVMDNSEQNDLIQFIEHFHKTHPNCNKSTMLGNLKK